MSDEEGSGEHKPPLGLFRKSDRPPPPEGDAASDEAARNEAARKRFKSTLLGVPAVTGAAAGDAKQSTLAGHPAVPPAPPPAAGPSGRPSVPNKPPKTLVGHPAVPPPQPGKPVVAPPKWRGAKAYLDGDVPELRQSGTPPPPPAASALQPPPAPAGEDALRDSVERFLQAEDEREGRSSVEAAPVAIVTSSAEPQGDERGSVEELDLDILDDAEEVEPSAAERAPATPATSAPPPTPPRRRPPPAPR